MLESSINLALGFFGHPIENQYELVVMVEDPGVRTLTRSNDNDSNISI
jgi:hypothetical protein